MDLFAWFADDWEMYAASAADESMPHSDFVSNGQSWESFECQSCYRAYACSSSDVGCHVSGSRCEDMAAYLNGLEAEAAVREAEETLKAGYFFQTSLHAVTERG